jgi:nucleotide-binding universal stress UspA family protein
MEIAEKFGAELHLVAAYSVPMIYQGTVGTDVIYPDNAMIIKYLYEHNHAQLEKFVAEAAEKARSLGIQVSTAILDGSPGRMIIQYADNQGIDLIAIGSHNRSAVDRFFLGSVSNYVLHHAKALVLIARD